MSIWTFPVQVRLRHDPPNAGAAQEIAAIIEEAVEDALGEDRLDYGTMEPLVVCGQPGEGFLRHMSLEKEPTL